MGVVITSFFKIGLSKKALLVLGYSAGARCHSTPYPFKNSTARCAAAISFYKIILHYKKTKLLVNKNLYIIPSKLVPAKAGNASPAFFCAK